MLNYYVLTTPLLVSLRKTIYTSTPGIYLVLTLRFRSFLQNPSERKSSKILYRGTSATHL